MPDDRTTRDPEVPESHAWPLEPSSLAVIFVQGIGGQTRGSTLLSWVEPLQRVLDAASGTGHSHVRIARVTGLSGDAPEIELEISGPNDRQVTWLLTEAHWAEAFHPSTAGEVVTWAAQFTYRAAKRVFLAFYGQLWFIIRYRLLPWVRDTFPWESGCLGAAASLAMWAVILFVSLSLLLALILPYVVALLALVVLAPVLVGVALVALGLFLVVQRIPVLGGRTTRLFAGLVTSIGDAQAYRDRAIQAAAMRDVVVGKMRELSGRVDKVVVVAHSQGAAIACRSLLQGATEWPDLLVTVGAGTSLLNDTGSVKAWNDLGGPPWVNVWTPMDPVPAGPIGDSAHDVRERMLETLWHQTRSGGFTVTTQDGTSRLRWSPGRGSACWTGSPEALVDVARRTDRLAALHEQPMTGRLDPEEAKRVAAFAIRGAGGQPVTWREDMRPREFTTPGPSEWPVANRWSIGRDHTSYTKNLTQVQHRLATQLVDLLPPSTGSLAGPSDNAEKWHVRRVRLVATSRFIAAVSAIAAVDQLAAARLEGPLLRAVSWGADHWNTGGWVLDYVDVSLRAILVLLVAGLVVFLALNGLLNASWNAWHQREGLRHVADPSARGIGGGLSGWIFGAMYAVLLVTTVIWVWRILPPVAPLWSLPLVVMGIAYPAWAILWPFFGSRPRALEPRRE